jgi:hypothetical protein
MTNFHQELQNYLQAKQGKNAYKVVLNELAICLVNDKEGFVAVLENAGIPASVENSDVTLIEKFVQNAPQNKKLLLGASLMINHRNKVTNFDGEDEISDAGVKNTYRVLYSNIGGVGDLVIGAVDVGGKIYEKESGKKTEFSDALKKRSEARQQMLQSVLNQKQSESTDKKSATNTKRKSKTTLIIVAGALVGLTIIGFIIYKVRKNK